jgi:CubicO group peptidase (beta-lactamase class C family)
MQNIFELQRCVPETQGVSSNAILEFVQEAERSIHNLHSLMLLRHGKVIAEGWWYPWRRETPHMLFSLTKSFTSTAVGLAVVEGRLGVDDPVLTYFTDEAPRKPSANLKAMKIKHLLSMSTGHDLDTTERMIHSRNPGKAFLSLPVEHTPGTHFVYNSGASQMLATILQKLTNQTLLEYLTPRLFNPLGIKEVAWESHPDGTNFGGWGLSLKTEDIARFGQLYLQQGIWNNQHILSEEWVAAASMKQVANGDDPTSDWCQGYGYHFWRCRYNIYRGDGAFGQFCIIMPDQQAVLAITAGIPTMQAVLNLVWEKLLPGFEEEPISTNREDQQALTQVLRKLAISPTQGAINSLIAKMVNGKTYSFEPNYETLHSISIEFGRDFGTLTYRLLGGGERRGTHKLEFGYSCWREDQAVLASPSMRRVAASGTWTAEDTFSLTICQYETPFIGTLDFIFSERRVLHKFTVNVSFGPTEYPELVGVVV